MSASPGPAAPARSGGMRWSAKIGRVAGIDLRVHAAFPLLLVWVAWTYYSSGQSWAEAIGGIVYVLLLFAVVVLHELGHALAARRYGIETRDITLLPIGGLARLERMPEEPKQELVIALAGPAVNVVLALLLLPIVLLTRSSVSAQHVLAPNLSIWQQLLVTNGILAVFNMVPAFPMDGGRVLRALLAMTLPYVQATNVAAAIGQGLAILMGLFGLLFGVPLLVLIAVFVWIGAAQEAMGVRLRAAFQGVRVDDVMVRSFATVEASSQLQDAVSLVMDGFQEEFPVLENGSLVGCLTRSDIVRGLSRGDETVSQALTREVRSAVAGEPLTEALRRLEGCECRVMPVLEGGALVGLLTPDNIAEFLMVHSASGRRG